MIKKLVFLMDLYDPADMVIALELKHDEYEFCFKSLDELVPEEDTEYYLMTFCEEITKIKDLTVFQQNLERVVDYYAMELEGYMSHKNYKDEINSLANRKNKAIKAKDSLELVKVSNKLTGIYWFIADKMEEISKDDEKVNEIFMIMKEARQEEVDEEEKHREIRNELDIINDLLKQYFSDEELETLEIQECSYNNRPIDKNDIIMELESHMLPNFLTQKDIRTTKGDTYTIKTNLGTLYRRADSMNVELLDKEE